MPYTCWMVAFVKGVTELMLLMLFTDVPLTSEAGVEVELDDELFFPTKIAVIMPPMANNPRRPNSQGLQQDLLYLGTGVEMVGL